MTDRHLPREQRPAGVQVLDHQLPVELLRPASEVPEPQPAFAGRPLADASTVVAHLKNAQATLDTEIHTCLRRSGMAADVGQSLSDRGQQVFCEFAGDGGVQWAVERRPDLQADHGVEISYESQEGGSEPLIDTRRPQLVDGRTNLSNGASTFETASLSRSAIPAASAVPAMLWSESVTAKSR